MSNRTAVPLQGHRPPLGLVLFDDGTIYVLDSDYLLGRRPDSDAAVIDGRLRALQLDDASRTLSRQHAEIRLHNWDAVLTDLGSANGTFVAGPKADRWHRLTPDQPFVLDAGTRVRMGHRTFTFQSARAEL
jgi:pSer/pThr/pTyr-binding forkhead associated (FHA) protein